LPWKVLFILEDIDHGMYHGAWELVGTEPWIKACVAAKFRCPKLLEAILDIHSPFEADSRQWGAILCASIEGDDDESVSIALQAGADPNAPSSTKSERCLQYAVNKACISSSRDRTLDLRRRNLIESLLKHGARPYGTLRGTSDCLYEACCNFHVELVRILLGEHMKADTQCLHYGMSLARAVGMASARGYQEMLHFLVSKGAETGWWSEVTIRPSAGRSGSMKVRFENLSIVQRILRECPRIIKPSSRATTHAVLRGAWKSTTGATLHFKHWLT
jgi:hypothetical protein